MNTKRTIFCVLFVLILVGCQAGPSAEQLASTSVAQTAAAASPTPPPTNTPLPTATAAATATPTLTPVPPTATPVPTWTPRPTATIVPSATPGPLVDDFSTLGPAWAKCDGVKVEDGRLLMGPYEASSTFNSCECATCKAYTTYRFSVDATYVEGQVDRDFGVQMENDKFVIYVGISPWQAYSISKYDWTTERWTQLTFKWSSLVKASKGTNHLEIEAKPSTKAGQVDIYIKINGTVAYVLYGQEALPSIPAFGVAWHAMGVAFDNFSYEETKQ
jgi:hypothetical protein